MWGKGGGIGQPLPFRITLPAFLLSLIPLRLVCVSVSVCRLGGNRNPIGWSGKHPTFRSSIHPSRGGGVGGGGGGEEGAAAAASPGLPRSLLGFKDRCCPAEGKRLRSSHSPAGASRLNHYTRVLSGPVEPCDDSNRSLIRTLILRWTPIKTIRSVESRAAL